MAKGASENILAAHIEQTLSVAWHCHCPAAPEISRAGRGRRGRREEGGGGGSEEVLSRPLRSERGRICLAVSRHLLTCTQSTAKCTQDTMVMSQQQSIEE